MIVYLPREASDPMLKVVDKRSHNIFITPGAHHPEVSDWMDGDKPKMFMVQFRDGKASVERNVGEYLIKHGYARRTLLILPQFKAA